MAWITRLARFRFTGPKRSYIAVNFVAAGARPGPFHQRAHWLRYSRIGVAAQSGRLCGSDVAPGGRPPGQRTRGRTRLRAEMRRVPRT
jgi:hypothetical protein